MFFRKHKTGPLLGQVWGARKYVNSLIANLETETEIAKYSETFPKMSTNNASSVILQNIMMDKNVQVTVDHFSIFLLYMMSG